MMRFLFLAIILCPLGLAAQRLDDLHAHEDSLTRLGYMIVNGKDASERFEADSQFTRTLVRALKIPYSFSFPFDSIENVSHIYAPDSAFRLLTWEVQIDVDNYRRHGAIQMRTPDGSLKLFALIDRTEMMDRPLDTVTSNDYWVGNIYYRIVLKKYQNKKYYTLLGYDEHNESSTRKWIEVLTFDDHGRPVFGGNFFVFPPGDPVHPQPSPDRYMIEYKKGSNARVQFDPDLDLLIFDHLISESNEPEKHYTYVPDGDYEGFRWVNGRWVHINKVFTQKLLNGQAPVPQPLKTAPKIQGKG